MLGIAGKIISTVAGIIDKVVPDKAEANRIKGQLNAQALGIVASELEAQKSIIVAEANGQGWLQRSWRPLTMLFFVGMVGAHWFGFTAPNLSEQMILSVYDLIKLGLGGYVIGRSVEKTAPHLLNLTKRNN